MKKILIVFCMLILSLVTLSGCLSLGTTDNQGNGSISGTPSGTQKGNLGEYNVVIDSCRLATDYAGKPAVIVKYIFTNYSEDANSFMFSVSDTVYQNGISLDTAIVSGSNYSSDNQLKEIKTGVTLTVEVAYELDNTTDSIEVEVTELFSFNDLKVIKTFQLK